MDHNPNRNEAREEIATVYADLIEKGASHADACAGVRAYFRHLAERERGDQD